MRASSHIKPKENLQGTWELDARVVPFERVNGQDLANLIHGSIEQSQKFIMTPLPSILRVTQKQFVSLNPHTDAMYMTTDRLFTAVDSDGKVLGVMEVMIDREVDTIEEIDGIIEESEALLAEKDFSKMGLAKIDVDPTKPNVLTPDNWHNQI